MVLQDDFHNASHVDSLPGKEDIQYDCQSELANVKRNGFQIKNMSWDCKPHYT